MSAIITNTASNSHIGIDAALRADYPKDALCRTCQHILGQCTNITIEKIARNGHIIISL